MEEKNLTPQESMEIISRMIDASRQRVAMPDLSISIMWAALSVLTAATVLTLTLATGNPRFNFLWFAIPVIGLPLNFILMRKASAKKTVKTYIDSISDGIWSTVGYTAIYLTIMCGIFHLCGYPQAWIALMFYGFIIVGFGAAMQGIVIKESSYIAGGFFSILSGFFLVACMACGIPLKIIWVLPLYIVCFTVMFLVPAIIIRKKFNCKKQ